MGQVYRLVRIIPTGISVDRYGRLDGDVAKRKRGGDEKPPSGMVDGPWIDAIHRAMAACDRQDPKDPKQMKRWGQGDLALAARIRGNTVSDILNRKREPSISTLDQLARALSLPLGAMFLSEEEWRRMDAPAVTAQPTADETGRAIAAKILAGVAKGLAESMADLNPAAADTIQKRRA